jgi:hypothetical protein
MDNEKDFEIHINECMDLAYNESVKSHLTNLMKSTRRSKGEVYLVAKHYDLLNQEQYTEVVKILTAGIDLEKWKKKTKRNHH